MTFLISIFCKLGCKCVVFHAESPLCPRSASASPLSSCAHRPHHRCSERWRVTTSTPDIAQRRRDSTPVSHLYSISPACYIMFCCDIRGGEKFIIHPHVHESIYPSLDFQPVSCTRTALIFIMKHVIVALLM